MQYGKETTAISWSPLLKRHGGLFANPTNVKLRSRMMLATLRRLKVNISAMNVELSATMNAVESITNMNFDRSAQMEGPVVFQHDDGDTKTRIRMKYRHRFEHSVSSSFFAFTFWVEVLHQPSPPCVTMSVTISSIQDHYLHRKN